METYRALIKTDDDILANLYVKLAEQAVLDYTNRIELLPQMNAIVVELANFYVTNQDRQGITSRSEGAISETYSDDTNGDGLPGFVKARLNRYKLLHIVKNKLPGA